MIPVILYRIDNEKRMQRYYRMDVQPDLFGQWCLIREWGRIGSSSQRRSVPFPTPQDAEAALYRQRRAKERRGYAQSDWPIYQHAGMINENRNTRLTTTKTPAEK